MSFHLKNGLLKSIYYKNEFENTNQTYINSVKYKVG